MKAIKPYIISLCFPLMFIFVVGHNTTLDVLVWVMTWGLLSLALIAGLLASAGVIAISKVSALLTGADAIADLIRDEDSKNEIDEIVKKFKPMAKKPKYYLSIPLMILWLGSLAHIEWTATAVFYLIVSLFAWIGVHLLRAALDEIADKLGGVAQGVVDAPTTTKKKLKSLIE